MSLKYLKIFVLVAFLVGFWSKESSARLQCSYGGTCYECCECDNGGDWDCNTVYGDHNCSSSYDDIYFTTNSYDPATFYSQEGNSCCPSGESWDYISDECVVDGGGASYCPVGTEGCGTVGASQLYIKDATGFPSICCFSNEVNYLGNCCPSSWTEGMTIDTDCLCGGSYPVKSLNHCCASGEEWNGSACVVPCNPATDPNGGNKEEPNCDGSCDSGFVLQPASGYDPAMCVCPSGEVWSGSACVPACSDTGKGGFGESAKCDGSCDYSTGLYNSGTCGCNAGYEGTSIGGSCAACGYGMYRGGTITSLTSCNDCSSNQYTTGTTSISSSSCLTCPANSTRNATKNGCDCDTGYENPSGIDGGPVTTGQSCGLICPIGEVQNNSECWKISDKYLTCFEKADGTCNFAEDILPATSLGVLFRVITE